jgi:hypothetical protein
MNNNKNIMFSKPILPIHKRFIRANKKMAYSDPNFSHSFIYRIKMKYYTLIMMNFCYGACSSIVG